MNKILIKRKTKETNIVIIISFLKEKVIIDTKINFFNHMLEQMFKHSGIGIYLKARGDIKVDIHHIIEDIGISLGKIFLIIYRNKNFKRFNYSFIPMDEALTRIVFDISKRSYLNYNVYLKENITRFDKNIIYEFIKAFCENCKCTIHIDTLGINTHHILESIFKCLGLIIKKSLFIRTNFITTK